MKLDTDNIIYVCTDRTNAEVKLLVPRKLARLGIEIVELNLADPDPESTDAAEYKLLSQEMEELTFEV